MAPSRPGSGLDAGTRREPRPGSSPLLRTGEFRGNLPGGPCVPGRGCRKRSRGVEGTARPRTGQARVLVSAEECALGAASGGSRTSAGQAAPSPQRAGRQSSSLLHGPPGSGKGCLAPESQGPQDCRQVTGTLGSRPLPRPPPSPGGQLPPLGSCGPPPPLPHTRDQVSASPPEAVGLGLLPGHPGALVSPWKGPESSAQGGDALQACPQGPWALSGVPHPPRQGDSGFRCPGGAGAGSGWPPPGRPIQRGSGEAGPLAGAVPPASPACQSVPPGGGPASLSWPCLHGFLFFSFASSPLPSPTPFNLLQMLS